ncbi:hypothetical protein COU49_01395 [Candidatus Nomurabacteria bacterium CG10_big_fil_rev_8_21_14_0_10_35_16]|uniref:Uncharacterized protein n=1 Tax=Candidatus Nomurabacteria bacterium CG10_big_fil_rev_8_21_14_0_10_35_16 TaxID=1974731 RepID=A0A2H0TD88_9BACT|nr:MAG: hypothetical protein COU49_01395 [Candidatus Nomurabacteria bacterium CG10_big_fil_rev_8_21_14_0_10_35_16]
MTNKLQQTIKEELEKLPKENQEAIGSVNWVKISEEIGRKNNLLEEEINNLQVETLLILTGIEDFDLYALSIEREVGLSKSEAEKISKEVTEKIFDPILEKIPTEEQATPSASSENKNTDNAGDELDERFSGLSEGIRKIIVQSGYYTKLYVVAEENKLTVPQMGTLEEITTGVITNSIHPEDFEKMLVKNLGLPAGTVQKIVGEINEKILGPVREKMKEVYSRPESSAYEIKPQIKKNVVKVIRPTSEATDPLLDTMELKEGNPTVDQKMQPILGQKLADSYKASTVKTDHSIENMTKDKNVSRGAPKTYPPNADPYREIPE